MRGIRFGHRRPWASHLVRAAVVVVLCGAACLILLGLVFTAQALALVENIRDVPPTIGFMTGQVEQSEDGGVTWAAPPQQFRLPRQALLRTGSDGSCVLVFLDRSLVALVPGTTVQILPSAEKLRLSVVTGKAWVRFDYAVENSRNGIALSYATFLAAGAGSFSLEATEGASVVRVLEGSVAAVAQDGDARTLVGAGQTLAAGSNGLQPAVAFDVDLETAGWQSLLGQAGLSVTTTLPTATSLPGTTTTRPLPPDGPVGIPMGAIIMLAVLGAGALTVLAILGIFIYLGVNRHNRRRMARR